MRIRPIRRLIGVLILIAVLFSPIPRARAETTRGVAAADLILRTKASASSVPLATIREGRDFVILDSKGDWYKIETDSLTGYVMKKYVETGSAAEGQASSPTFLQKGDKGDAVKQLQENLKSLGYFIGEATGTFGDATRDAVTAFQKANGLDSDGAAGKNTLRAIEKLIDAAQNTTSSSEALKVGSEGDLVKQLQLALKEKGYFSEDITGYYGSKTEAAVKAYQAAHGITADGVAGTETLTALLDESAATTVRLGDTGSAVKELQRLLRGTGFYSGSIDGQFGEGTHSALLAFQKAAGLEPDGIAGRNTIAMLVSGKITFSGTPSGGESTETPVTATPTPAPTPDPEVPTVTVEPTPTPTPAPAATPTPADTSTVAPPQQNGSVLLVDWWSGEIGRVFPRKAIAQMYDIRSGITINIYHYGGTNHLDWEPATAEDMAKVTQMVNGDYSWSARPVIFIAPNGNRYAAATNTMPHGQYHLTDNNCDGQMCMHFLNSYTHGGQKPNADMQSMIQYAFQHG